MSKKVLGVKTLRGFIEFTKATVSKVDNSKVVIHEQFADAINQIDINQLGGIVYGKFADIGFESVTVTPVMNGSNWSVQTEPILNVSGVKGTDVPVVLATGEAIINGLGLMDDIVYKINAVLKNNQIYLSVTVINGILAEGLEITIPSFTIKANTFVLDFYNVSDGETVKVFN